MNIKNIGDRVRNVRKNKQLTQKKFSNLAGVASSYLAIIETGRKQPSYNFIVSLAQAFQINANWLLFGTGPMYQSYQQNREQPQHQIQEQDAEYWTKGDDSRVENIKTWIDDWWKNADDRERIWLEIQMGRSFPEYREWQQQKNTKKKHTTHTQQ